MKWVEKGNALALGAIIWIVLIVSVLQFTAFNLDFYKEQYASRDTAQMIGISENDLMHVTDVLLHYTSGQHADMNVEATVNGTLQPFYNQREIDHMVDVRNLYLNVIMIRNILLIFAIVNIIALFVLKRKATLALLQFGLTWVSVGLGALLLIIGSFAVINFDAFWTAFHHLFFSNNDLWLLDPSTDNLINLVPERFFIDLILMIVIHFGLILITLFTFLKAMQEKGINQNVLKIIAVVTMTIDHLGYFLFPEIRELRIIGRIAYPIFTYLFALSYRFTSDRKVLLTRVLLFACGGQLLIIAAGEIGFVNILFLFVLGMLAFWILDHSKVSLTTIMAILIIAFMAEVSNIDYGAYGILTLVIFYLYHQNRRKQFLWFSILTVVFSFEWLIIKLITDPVYWTYLSNIFGNGIYSLTNNFPQIFALIALLPLSLYFYKAPKNKQALVYKTTQYFYYAYYPVHFALLAYLAVHL